MAGKHISKNFYRIFLLVAMWFGASMPSTADWNSGTVTGVVVETGEIQINGVPYLSNAQTLSKPQGLIKLLRPGQGVRFEAQGRLIKQIELQNLPLT